jgi:hypothetical protein
MTFFDFDFILLRDSLSYIYKTHTNWKTNFKSFMNSNLSIIKLNVSAISGSSNIKPIFNLLPTRCGEFPDQCLHSSLWFVSWALVVSSAAGGSRHCPSQNPTKINQNYPLTRRSAGAFALHLKRPLRNEVSKSKKSIMCYSKRDKSV